MHVECSDSLTDIKKFVLKSRRLIVGVIHVICELKEMALCHVGSEPKRGTLSMEMVVVDCCGGTHAFSGAGSLSSST